MENVEESRLFYKEGPSKGYVDIPYILSSGFPFIFIWAGRGTGKTYGALKTVIEERRTFLLTRTKQTTADAISKPQLSPFKSVNRDLDTNIQPFAVTKDIKAYYRCENEKPVGDMMGYLAALSTLANIRGFDGSDIDLWIYDEFIPEPHEKKLEGQGEAFMNAYETINRNRELDGHPPLQVLCLANANKLGNPMFLHLGIVRIADQMRRDGTMVKMLPERQMLLIDLKGSEISERKKDTALYKLNPGSEFNRMALDNEFATEEMGIIKSRNLKEFRPVVTVGELTVYKHKSSNYYYISTHRMGSPETYGAGMMDLKRFRKKCMWLWRAYIDNRIEFEEYLCEVLLTKYFE